MRRVAALLIALRCLALRVATAAAATSTTPTDIDATLLFRRILQNSHSPVDATSEPPCDLECKNGGRCVYISGTVEDWRYFAQSGILVQKCKCPPGWGGVGCEMPVEQCVSDKDPQTGESVRICELSRLPCDFLPDGTSTCACHVADAVDPDGLAGNACRHWNTEYCEGKLDLRAETIYLCTNGGKCQSDFIAAQIAPGDTKVNAEYADAGCVCNKHFYGPHCEFLDFDANHNIAMQEGFGGVQAWRDIDADGENGGNLVYVVLVVVIAGVVALFLYRRHRRQRLMKRSTMVVAGVFKDQQDNVEFADTTALPPGGEDPYVDAVMTGMQDVDLQNHENNVGQEEEEEEEYRDPMEPPAATETSTTSTLENASLSLVDDKELNNSDEKLSDEEMATPLQVQKPKCEEATHHFFT